MGGSNSKPVEKEHRHHRHHQKNEDIDENEKNEVEEESSEHQEKESREEEPREAKQSKKRQPMKLNRRFIPETIADPAEGEPCGLYVDGLNYHWEKEKFAKFLKNQGINFTFALKKKSKNFGIIRFENNQDRAEAYKTLIHLGDIGGRQLFVVALEKGKDLSSKKCEKLRKRALSNLDTRDVLDVIAPWHNIPYEEQLERKAAKFTEILAPIIPDQENSITVYPAPKITGYRNNVELTIGRDIDDNICVGFNLGSRIEDLIAPVTSTFACPERTPELAEKIRKFVIDSGIPIFDRITNVGTWKFVKIRSNEANEVQLMMVVYGTLEEDAVNAFKSAFENEVDSLYYCETKSFESYGKDPNIVHLSGKPVLIEKLRGLQFEISPMSFFQTNTPGAEVLFQKIEELSGVDENTVLLDICCGTGVIGLALANKVKKVVGVDISEQAIADAQRNADRNGITNTEYMAAKAEDAIPEILEKYAVDGQKVVAICDPPRDGLLKKGLRSIRNCELLKRVVYISCKADSLVRDAQKYLFSDHIQGTEPFKPIKYFGVDMFPHTSKCEIVMLMERE